MKLTVLTAACHRPEAWKLSELYMSRQTLQPTQWLVLDDDETATVCTMGQDYHYWPEMRSRGSMVKKIRRVMANKMIKGDAVVFWENDDAYMPDYLAWCADGLARNNIFGEGFALYYNVRGRFWAEHTNMKHAALCSTSLTKALFPWLAKQANLSDEPHIDQRIWNRCPLPGRVVNPHINGPRRVVGIKAMPGKAGYSWGHGDRDQNSKDDVNLDKLRAMIGDDADAYAPFYVPPPAPVPKISAVAKITAGTPTKPYDPATATSAPVKQKPAAPVVIETQPSFVAVGDGPFAKGHGPNWAKWLGHLRGTPAIGIEIGTFRGESAEWTLENIFTHAESRLHCVDPFTGSPEHERHKIDISTIEQDARARLARFGERVTINKFFSKDFLYEANRSADLLADFIYVDGLHTSVGVIRDAVCAFDVLKVGGVMIFDDYNWREMPHELDLPKTAIDAFLKIYSRQIEVLRPTGWQIAIRKLADA